MTCFTLTGNPVSSYISLSEAARVHNVDHRGISDCCLRSKLYMGKYLWCYSDEFEEFMEIVEYVSNNAIRIFKEKNKTIQVFSLLGDLIKEFSTFSAAASYLGVTTNVIRKQLRGKPTIEEAKYLYNLKEHLIE